MPGQQPRATKPRRGRLASSLASENAPLDGLDAVHVRNYYHEARHSVVVAVETTEGDEVGADRHALAPGQSAQTRADLDPGEYVLRVWVDGVERRRRHCRLGPAEADTAVVELGNGAVSVTTGARGSLVVE